MSSSFYFSQHDIQENCLEFAGFGISCLHNCSTNAQHIIAMGF